MDVMFFKTSDLNFQETKIEYYVSSQKENKAFTPYTPFVPNNNYNFQTRMHIASYDNQVIETENPLIKKSSLLVKGVLSSSNPNISPVIDVQQISAFAVANQINSQTASAVNDVDIDTRKILAGKDLAAADISMIGTGTITTSTSSTSVTGTSTTFTTQIVAGNILKTAAGVTIGTVATTPTANGTLTLTGNAAVALTSQQFYIYSTPSLVFENVTVNGKTVGQIRTNIDTADNLLATAGIGRTIKITNVHANVDGTYVVTDINQIDDLTTYAGNSELDLTKVILDKAFAGNVNMDMITDTDFSIVVYDKFVDDLAPVGCHNAANYITRTLSLTDAASTIKILFDSNIVNNTEVKVYYRTWTGNVDLRKIPYIDTGFTSTNSDAENKFIERGIDIKNIAPFNNVSIKIVLKSSNPVFVPKIKNLRLLALS